MPFPLTFGLTIQSDPSLLRTSHDSANRPPPGAERVDVATFKPVFVPRAERETQKLKDKKDGRGKDKKKAKAIVSFEDDDDDSGAALAIAPQADKDKDKSRKKKKRRKEKGDAEGAGDDVEMWVEKLPPQAVTKFVDAPESAEGKVQLEGPAPPPTSSIQAQVAEGPPRGRKRAIDIL